MHLNVSSSYENARPPALAQKIPLTCYIVPVLLRFNGIQSGQSRNLPSLEAPWRLQAEWQKRFRHWVDPGERGIQEKSVWTLPCRLLAESLNCKGSPLSASLPTSEFAKSSWGEAILTNVKERCERFRRMSRIKSKHMLWEKIASSMRKRPNRMWVGRQETEEANAAPRGVGKRPQHPREQVGYSGKIRLTTRLRFTLPTQPEERGRSAGVLFPSLSDILKPIFKNLPKMAQSPLLS